jgi:hypothetical protein
MNEPPAASCTSVPAVMTVAVSTFTVTACAEL